MVSVRKNWFESVACMNKKAVLPESLLYSMLSTVYTLL